MVAMITDAVSIYNRLYRFSNLISMAAFSDYYEKENKRLIEILQKERIQRKKIDQAAINFLQKVKINYENKIQFLNTELNTLKKEKEIWNSEDLKEVRFDLRVAQREISKQKDQIEYLRSVRKEAEDETKSLRLLFAEKEKEITLCKEQCESLNSELESYKNEKLNLNAQIQTCNKTIQQLNDKNECMQKLNDTLKKACSEIEIQATEFQSRYFSQIDVYNKLLEEKQLMLEKLNRLKNDLETIENKYSNQVIEMSEHVKFLETNVSQSQVKIDNLQKSLNMKEQELEKEQEFHLMYEHNMPNLILQNEEKSKVIEDLSKKIETYDNELFNLKEEAALHITKITSLNAQNKNLAKGLEDSLNKCETLQNRIEVIVNEFETRQSKYDLELLKMNETNQQQLKLIDLLQEKIEKIKKPWFGINSPASKISNPTLAATKSNNQLKEMEAAFEREKTKNKMLMQQIDEAKSELRYCQIEMEKIKKNSIEPEQPVVEDFTSKNLDKSLLSIPSAPPVLDYELENTSSDSTSTTDNNEYFEDQQFTFTDSILNELGEKKISNIPINQ